MNRKATIAAIAILVVLGIAVTVLTSGLLVNQQALTSTGNVGGKVSSSNDIGIYRDAAATINCTNFNWGNVNVGGTVTETVYVKNTGNAPETLSLTTSNWSPASANASLTLTWNQQGAYLPAGSIVPATLSLTAASDAGAFN